ncbi:hypothetical protein U3A58_04165 [Algoriphagus sp. C2-6-M1]|uniref:hypothetical protein n=1 Tax=Algoriphagus persicinus TaxID=3108754 RepID=UPI002B3EE732|nr:hypothetical protein [Algoriphagus sp. C2-6-M1]MEB2779578.1 hypothetical protein [Algoriphagus sp. C2-6-M1]
MKLSTFSIIWAVLYVGFGLGLLIIPVQFMATYGVTLDSNGTLMARSFGTALTAYALTFFLNRKIAATDKGWYNLLLTSFIYNIVDIPIMLMATLDGVMNSLGWIPVALHVFLAATFGYFTFKKGQG